MNDDAEKLRAFLTDGSGEADALWLESMKERYPFFQLPSAMSLRGRMEGMSEGERSKAVAAMMVALSDPEAARRLFEGGEVPEEPFYPLEEPKATPSTDQTIDRFLAAYGTGDPSETETLEKLIFNPVADYSQQLAREEMADMPDSTPTGNLQDDRINRFILSVRSRRDEEEPEPEVKAPAPVSDNSLLSESLAKIYIKTRRYERAYEILSRLSLEFPEKNAYFADQLRFLRKLMLAEKIRRERNGNENKPK